MRQGKAAGTGPDSGRERGQVLIMFVLMLAVLMGMVGLAIDVGIILQQRRSLQNAADAAALAGARELPNIIAAEDKAKEYAGKNGVDLTDSDYTFTSTTPYNGDPGRIEVRLSRQTDYLFGRVLGLTSTDVRARAVAEAVPSSGGGGNYAIFVINNNCAANDPLLIPGQLTAVTGAVHSNSTILMSGSNNSFNGAITHSCSFQDGGQNNTYNPPPAQSGNRPSPLDYTYASFPCTYNLTGSGNLNSVPEAWVGGNPSSNQLMPGVYCSTEDIQLSGSDVSGNVTFVAQDEVKISGSNFNLTAFYNDVLGFSAASHEQAIDMSGSGGTWRGYFYAPDGRVKIAGSGNLSIAGSLVADRVTVSGSDFSIDSSGLTNSTPAPNTIRLVE